MTREELLTLCHFYHGENSCPLEFDGKLEGKLWTAERSLCEHILLDYQLQPRETPRQVFDEYVDAMIGKWCPYEYKETMSLYNDVVNNRISTQPPLVTPNFVRYLTHNEIFVFGSNLQGVHAGGAARIAYEKFGAEWGVGVGRTGQCYAIPTMQGGVETIRPYVDEFIEYAKQHQELIFLVTRIGCGIAGFTDQQIAPLFAVAQDHTNIALPAEWRKMRGETPAPNHEEISSLLEYTHFYKGEEEPDEVLDSIEMARLYWDYERVWVKWELHPDENYKEDLRYFHRVFQGEKIHHDVPVGLQAIFANRIEHWGTCQVTLNSLNRFIDGYLKAAEEYNRRK